MELRHLRHFVALAHAKNFHRAAANLNLAQPALSVSIRKFEEELGVQLVIRHSRGVTLTPEGEVTATQAQDILRRADEVRAFASQVSQGVRGRLAIGFVASATFSLIPSIVAIFRKRFPDVKLRLRETTHVEITRSLLNGELDIGIIRTPLSVRPGVELIPLTADNMVLAIPKDHPFASQTRVEMEDLKDEPLILYSRSGTSSLRTLIDLNFSALGITPTVVEEVAHLHTMIALVESGLGLAFVPSVARLFAHDRVAIANVYFRGTAIPTGLALAYPMDGLRLLGSQFRSICIEQNWGNPS
ncbi:LysR family transcriptional regulator [Sphingopyxis macrogoltabida]|uniref:HTH lysR-type domain-containing protein n=1 Tax=Sphingopyxis macrogoltabida TaxID=33050 RepID=A0AAC9FHI6_SPHMC|nr:LysR family transcriptional regulator [Sphingopyxis macrogoltabida]ALJ16386.1 hypothetical protein LH19_26665 [Sphingopyxis macrogoltabida]AMU92621.1 hypothetical protein ATM17_30655 [Sphingopyxis macrogoltabida]